MPTIPEDRKAAARLLGKSQFKDFAKHVADHFARGKRFLDMMPAQPIAHPDDVEKATTDDAA
jgi:hypothetical protein